VNLFVEVFQEFLSGVGKSGSDLLVEFFL